MKYIYILTSLLIFPAPLSAQDLIVTNNGDSLNCKITEIKNEEVYFTYKHQNEIKSTWLRLDRIKVCQLKYFEESEVPVEKILAKKIYPRIRVAIHGGGAYKTARLYPNIPSDLVRYTKKLKFGFGYGLDFSYYFSEYLGIGVGYNGFFTKNEIKNREVFVPDVNGGYYASLGKLQNTIRMDFIGAFIQSRKLSVNKKHIFSCGLGIGYLEYNNKEIANLQSTTLKGGTIGVCGNIIYDIMIYKFLAAGFQLSYLFGFLPQAKINDGNNIKTLNIDENISRIDLSVGLRFYTWKYSPFARSCKAKK